MTELNLQVHEISCEEHIANVKSLISCEVNWSDFTKDKLVMDFISKFKDLGIDKTLFNYVINDNTLFDKLTLIIDPKFSSSMNGKSNRHSTLEVTEKYCDYVEKNYKVKSFYSKYVVTNKFYDGTISIYDKYNNSKNKIKVFDYVPSKNLILLYCYNYLDKPQFEDNYYLLHLYNLLKNQIHKHKIKKIDVKDAILNDWCERISVSISNAIYDLDYKEKSNDDDIQYCNDRLAKLISENHIISNQIDNMMKMRHNGIKKIKDEIEKINNLKFITHHSIEPDKINFHTTDLGIKYRNRWVPGGEYVITISNNKIYVTNKKPLMYTKYSGVVIKIHHPHVHSATKVPCFGEEGNKEVLQMISSFNFHDLLYRVLAFLRSVNVHGTYHDMIKWVYGKTKRDNAYDENKLSYSEVCNEVNKEYDN